jgi:DNA-binding CsgD family transcriptional regulator
VTRRDQAGDSSPARKPGILVVTSALKLVALNGEAQDIMDELVGAETGMRAKGVFPSQLRDLCRRVATLAAGREDNSLDTSTVTGTITVGKGTVSLTCFPLVHPLYPAHASIVLLMWRSRSLDEEAIALARQRFNLTAREMTVLEYLTKGLTNKQIARELHIVEQTVKDHVKNIMQKSRSRTRTGLVSQTLQLK